jgi:hypothetical protein
LHSPFKGTFTFQSPVFAIYLIISNDFIKYASVVHI